MASTPLEVRSDQALGFSEGSKDNRSMALRASLRSSSDRSSPSSLSTAPLSAFSDLAAASWRSATPSHALMESALTPVASSLTWSRLSQTSTVVVVVSAFGALDPVCWATSRASTGNRTRYPRPLTGASATVCTVEADCLPPPAAVLAEPAPVVPPPMRADPSWKSETGWSTAFMPERSAPWVRAVDPEWDTERSSRWTSVDSFPVDSSPVAPMMVAPSGSIWVNSFVSSPGTTKGPYGSLPTRVAPSPPDAWPNSPRSTCPSTAAPSMGPRDPAPFRRRCSTASATLFWREASGFQPIAFASAISAASAMGP